MPNPWYPTATQLSGSHAGYAYGHTSMQSAVAHFTVGRDSTGPGLSGLYPILIRRNGEVVQFGEIDGLYYHAGQPYNSRGPGIEIEYHPSYDPVIFTDEARAATAKLIRWLETEWGIPAEYHDDPNDKRADWRGWISHRSVVSDADVHSDFWPQEDWDAMVAPAPAPTPTKASLTVDYLLANTDSGKYTLCTAFGETPDLDDGYAHALMDGGMPVVKIDGVGAQNLLLIRAGHRK